MPLIDGSYKRPSGAFESEKEKVWVAPDNSEPTLSNVGVADVGAVSGVDVDAKVDSGVDAGIGSGVGAVLAVDAEAGSGVGAVVESVEGADATEGVDSVSAAKVGVLG